MNFYDVISQEDLKLNSTEQKIIEYLLKHIGQINGLKISQISNDLYIAPNSVIRLCKKLGYSGFTQMKYAMANAHQKDEKLEQEHWHSSIDIINQTYKLNQQHTIEDVVRLLRDTDQLVFFGLGLSRFPAEELAKKLRYLGKMVFVPDDRDNCIQYANNLKKGQTAFFFSCSGNTDIITKLVHIAKTKNIPIISLTGISQNMLTNYSDYKLYAYINKIEYQGADISSRTGFYFVTDLIFNEYLRQGFLLDKS